MTNKAMKEFDWKEGIPDDRIKMFCSYCIQEEIEAMKSRNMYRRLRGLADIHLKKEFEALEKERYEKS